MIKINGEKKIESETKLKTTDQLAQRLLYVN